MYRSYTVCRTNTSFPASNRPDLTKQLFNNPFLVKDGLLQEQGWESSSWRSLGCQQTCTIPLHSRHRSSRLSSCSFSSCCCFFLARTQPKARGMCRGGCSCGSKSIWYSCLSQRTVRGRRLHGATRSMLERMRQWNCRLDSLRVRRVTWESRREICGCCHAHSNCSKEEDLLDVVILLHENDN